MEDPGKSSPVPAPITVEPVSIVYWSDIFSWSFVGWYVALLVGLWGALMGTGDYSVASVFFVLAACLFVVKSWHITRMYHTMRRVIPFAGCIIAASLLVGVVLHWTSGKIEEAKKQRSQLAQLDLLPALQGQVKQVPKLQDQIDNLKKQNEAANSKIQTKEDTVERLSRALARQLSKTETRLSTNINQYRTDTTTAVSKILRPGRTLENRKDDLVRELKKVGTGTHEFAISTARGSQECLNVANEIVAAFKEAGWKQTRTHFGLTIGDGEKLQLLIKPGSNTIDGLTPDQLTVGRAFYSIGMPLNEGNMDRMNNEWPVEIYVGLQ